VWLVGLGPGLLAHFASVFEFGGGMVLFVVVSGIEMYILQTQLGVVRIEMYSLQA
jgi:hypothetical protein